MDDNSTTHLQYGHLGSAIYHPDTQIWTFSRTLTPAPHISYTGVTETTVSSPLTLTHTSTTVEKAPLLPEYPSLVPGFHLAPNETLSHIITAASEICDPLVSSLLDFGHAVDWDIDTSGRRAVPVVAFVSGECGNAISFRTITDHTVDLNQDSATQLRVPAIGDEITFEWLAGGAPIRQICFSRAPEERATFMAARSQCSTIIFRPQYHRSPVSVPVCGSDGDRIHNYSRSHFNPNSLVEILPSNTGDLPHADVTFNPWNQKQFALVDEDGNWGVWELSNQHRRSKDNWSAECVNSGSLPWIGVDDGQDAGKSGRHDGWMAIEWVGDENQIVVCDRRCAMLYLMEDGQSHSYQIDLGFKRKSEWILDVQRSTCNSSHFFILTTSRIFWLDIEPSFVPLYGDSQPSLYPRLSWRHFRDSDDTTLQLTSLTMDKDFYLVLYSRLNQLVLAFHCPNSTGRPSDSAPAPDPFILRVPSSSDNTEETDLGSNQNYFSTLVFKEIAYSPSALGKTYYDPSLRLLKLFAVDTRLSIRESLYSASSQGNSGAKQSRGRDILRVKKLYMTGRQKTHVHSSSDFIVDDWDESVFGSSTIVDSGIDSIAPLADRQWTLDYTQIYAIASGSLDLLPQNSAETFEVSFQESVKDLADRVSSATLDDQVTSQTALEIIGKTPMLDDIDQNAQDLNTFVSRYISKHTDSKGPIRCLVQLFDPLRSLSSPSLLKHVEPLKLDLIAIYDRLVNTWLVNLPRNTPGRARIAKEKVIRRFVADIAFAQILAVRKANLPEDKDQQSQIEDEPFFSSAPGDPESQGEMCPTFSALSSYTTFARKGPASRNVDHILDSWKPGNNPAAHTSGYDGLRPSNRPATSKRKSRKKMVQSVSLDSSQPPAVSSPAAAIRDWGSQPDNSQPPMIRLQSSQLTEELPMTQTERGVFGSREASRKAGIKARKKKRAAGF